MIFDDFSFDVEDAKRATPRNYPEHQFITRAELSAALVRTERTFLRLVCCSESSSDADAGPRNGIKTYRGTRIKPWLLHPQRKRVYCMGSWQKRFDQDSPCENISCACGVGGKGVYA